MYGIDFSELSLSSKLGICWGFFWRGIAISVGSTVCGALLGALVGLLFGLLGVGKGAITAVAGVFGLVVGLGFLYIYVRWILGSRLGGFRLILVPADDA